ncbi:MAG: ABC transporter permease [Parvularculales bacterium]
MALPPSASLFERIWYVFFRVICGAVLIFLIAPILIIIPLSFNAEPYFTFTPGMLTLDPDAFSLRWYKDVITNGMAAPEDPFSFAWLLDSWQNSQWIHSAKNSFFIAICATALATSLGTLAALGISRANMPFRALIMSLLISPMIVPIIITATGLFFFYSSIGLAQTHLGIILAHATLGIPFVIITVTATLASFDQNLSRAGASLGATAPTVFFKITLPLILPGVIAGALFAFALSFDEVVTILFLAGFEQRTIPRQMWAGLREQISPTILAVASILILLSVMLLSSIEILRRRSEIAGRTGS